VICNSDRPTGPREPWASITEGPVARALNRRISPCGPVSVPDVTITSPSCEAMVALSAL
jgi:hypothetical protein